MMKVYADPGCRAKDNPAEAPAPADLAPAPPAVVCCDRPGEGGMQLMTADDLAARVRRLDALARGLAKELAAVRANTLTVLLYRERRGYLEALGQALGGVEGARVTMARAVRSLTWAMLTLLRVRGKDHGVPDDGRPCGVKNGNGAMVKLPERETLATTLAKLKPAPRGP